jgi:hypothetical protein
MKRVHPLAEVLHGLTERRGRRERAVDEHRRIERGVEHVPFDIHPQTVRQRDHVFFDQHRRSPVDAASRRRGMQQARNGAVRQHAPLKLMHRIKAPATSIRASRRGSALTAPILSTQGISKTDHSDGKYERFKFSAGFMLCRIAGRARRSFEYMTLRSF